MGKGGRAIAGGASENLALSPLEPAHRHAATRHDSWLSLLGYRRRHDAISMLYIKGIEMTHGKLGGITVAVLAEFGVGEGGWKVAVIGLQTAAARRGGGKSMTAVQPGLTSRLLA